MVDARADAAMPSLPVVVEGHALSLLFDTGWPGLALFPDVLSALPGDRRESPVRDVWGTPVTMIPLAPVTYRVGTRTGVHRWPERTPDHHSVFESAGLQGIAGIGAVAHLASVVEFDSPARICLSGPPCTSAPKLWTQVDAGGQALSALVDTGSLETTIKLPWVDADALVTREGKRFPITKRAGSTAVKNRWYGGARMDGRIAEAVIGWRQLREMRWRWDVCGGSITFR